MSLPSGSLRTGRRDRCIDADGDNKDVRSDAAERPVKPEFFVDLDGTLKTHHEMDEGPFQVQAEWGLHHYDVRPGYEEFLSALAGMGRVNLSTAGGRRYASTILRQMGIEGVFARRFDAQSWRHGISYTPGAIFIDDDVYMARDKARCMHWPGMPPDNDELDKRIVIVPSYWGGSDGALQQVLSAVKALIPIVCGQESEEEDDIIFPEDPDIIFPDDPNIIL